MASPEESGDGAAGEGVDVFDIKNVEVEAVHFLLAAKEELRDKVQVYDEFIQTMLEIRTNLDGESFSLESGNATVRALFVGQPRLVKGFQDLSEGRKPFRDEPHALCDPMVFLQNLKTCPGVSEDEYNTFLETLLQFYDRRTMNIEDLVGQVTGFLGRYPKLLEEFRSYLPPHLAAVPLPHDQSVKSAKTSLGDKAGTSFTSDANHRLVVRLKEPNGKHKKVHSSEHSRHGRKKLKHGHREFRNLEEVLKADASVNDMIEDDGDKKDGEDGCFPFRDDKLPPMVDLENCPRCTASYVLLPENCRTLQSKKRTKLEEAVLNDAWVSVTSGSEYKVRTKNQYEEIISSCEDDMFESDMLLQRFRTTAEVIEDLQYVPESNLKMKVEERLTPIHRRCIEQLYDVHGLEVLDALSENTSTALTVILSRLIQKIEELTKARLSLKNTWADVLGNNFYKSLDHRSSSSK